MLPLSDAIGFEKQDDIGLLWIDKPPVNALGLRVRKAIISGIEMAMADDSIRALVFISGGKIFCGGADIHEFGTPLQFEIPRLRDIFALLDQAPKPVVAAAHGIAFGGGLELALSCHYRIADATVRFGLPEVKLGLLPGSGGTQRLTRLIGPEKALSMILSGDPVGADQALETGLMDALITGDLKAGAVAFARKVADIRPLPKTSEMTGKPGAAWNDPPLFAHYRQHLKKTRRGFDAPLACVDAVEAATTLSFDHGMRAERIFFMEQMANPQAAAQRHVFFARRQAAKIPVGVSDDTGVADRMMARCRKTCSHLFREGVLPARVDRVLHDFGFPPDFFSGHEKKENSDCAEASPRLIDFSKKKGYTRHVISDTEILHRCIYPIINEGAVILEEQKTVRPGDLDVIWINSCGWPAYRGGPMFYADQTGLFVVLKILFALQARYGDDFRPAPLLERLVRQGKTVGMVRP